MSGFFNLRTAKDMVDKAEREYGRLKGEPSSDNIFNFFITAHHFIDYLKKGKEVSNRKIEKFRREPDMRRCADVCNQGKHAYLTQGAFDPKYSNARPAPIAMVPSGALGSSALNTHPFGGSPPKALYYPGNLLHKPEQVLILPLADRVMQRLRDFVIQHNLK